MAPRSTHYLPSPVAESAANPGRVAAPGGFLKSNEPKALVEPLLPMNRKGLRIPFSLQPILFPLILWFAVMDKTYAPKDQHSYRQGRSTVVNLSFDMYVYISSSFLHSSNQTVSKHAEIQTLLPSTSLLNISFKKHASKTACVWVCFHGSSRLHSFPNRQALS